DASTVGQLNGDSPRHIGVIQSAFTLPQDFSLNVIFRHASSIFGTDQKAPGYSTGDVRFAKRLTRDVELAIVGQNLLQPHHVEYGSGIGIRRSGYLNLIWTH